MLLYNCRLAFESIRRHPLLSTLLIAGIALGVGVSTAGITVYRIFTGDPLPHKSAGLHYVRLDAWDPEKQAPHIGGIPSQITYRDMRGIMESDIPHRQTATFKSRMTLYPENRDIRPSREMVRLAFSDFFAMFDVPFRYGSAWDRAAEAVPERVVVLGSEINDRLFGGRNSVGETVRLDDAEHRVVGVLDDWTPKVKFYDMTQSPFQRAEQIFMPLNQIIPLEIGSSGNRDGWQQTPPGLEFAERLSVTESVFLQMWVELEGPAQHAAYQSFLDAYAREQKKLGRFQRPIDNRVTPLLELMREYGAIPPQAAIMAVLAILFLVACAVNLIGLFLGKFLARAPIVGVRRALGASRRAIFLQHIVECELVGLLGGVVGVPLAMFGLALMNRAFRAIAGTEGFFSFDAPMIAAAAFLSLVAGLLAGLYPAWRICRIPPAQHLKTQ